MYVLDVEVVAQETTLILLMKGVKGKDILRVDLGLVLKVPNLILRMI